jgi:hypothetical protein
MSTSSAAARNARINGVSMNALLAAGSAVSYPTFRIRTSANADLIVVNLHQTTPIGTAVNGVATVAAPQGEASWVDFTQTGTSGTAAKAVLCDRDNTVTETLSVGVTGSGEEVTLASLTIDGAVGVTFGAAPTITAVETYDPTP